MHRSTNGFLCMKLLWQKTLTVVSFVGNKTYFICLSYIKSAGMRPTLGVSKNIKIIVEKRI